MSWRGRGASAFPVAMRWRDGGSGIAARPDADQAAVNGGAPQERGSPAVPVRPSAGRRTTRACPISMVKRVVAQQAVFCDAQAGGGGDEIWVAGQDEAVMSPSRCTDEPWRRASSIPRSDRRAHRRQACTSSAGRTFGGFVHGFRVNPAPSGKVAQTDRGKSLTTLGGVVPVPPGARPSRVCART